MVEMTDLEEAIKAIDQVGREWSVFATGLCKGYLPMINKKNNEIYFSSFYF